MADCQALLTTVESSPGPLDDETLGRVICAVLGVEFRSSVHVWGAEDIDATHAVYGGDGSAPLWSGPRHSAPDVSIDAAVGLVEQCGLSWVLSSRGVAIVERETYVSKLAKAATPPLSLLAALLRAREAEHG
ncbi:hypothetical protein [Chelatococcus reniformis]|uniref:Uncharacterized protein n=1 Tax=Chelatococcus reniformis TaxID=1494448 RepID=A0A916UFI1_9HYPH|nr:hypothetical protein [Chelatococcus reniformis]GGC70406.1 hypothetical protein GCM10010994_31160 [Chelatococcus reniformis]